MTPRDFLAQLIHDAGCPNTGCQPLRLDYHRADTIIAAGWAPVAAPTTRCGMPYMTGSATTCALPEGHREAHHNGAPHNGNGMRWWN